MGEAGAPEPVVTLADVLAATTGPGPVWTVSSADLNVNLLAFAGLGVPRHVNADLDVLVLRVAGAGVLELDGVDYPLRAGQACLVPNGAARSLRSAGGSFAYLMCHRRGGGLWPDGSPPQTQAEDG
jgi:hypothetical protein